MNEAELFRKLGGAYATLIEHLDASTPDEFEKQLHMIFSQAEARQVGGVVYVLATKKGIPRLKGESNVIYIGQTKNSLSQRYRRKEVRCICDCWERYDHIIRTYGPISVHYKMLNGDDPRTAEKDLLKWYKEEHLEFPPVNCKL